ncbi:hypothetical protein M3S04_04845 [Xanthomonas sp. PPL139]|uniref:hypothetical protein n=1 Tax=unclassified Xanthomonas TaxID=2643310 RepID=UPI0033B833EF
MRPQHDSAASPPAHASADPEAATILWRTTVPGVAAHRLWLDERTGQVLVADGWGVSFGALRVRALSMATGDEVASVALGNQARAFASDGEGSVLAATETKLFRLEAGTLSVAEKWTSRIPRYVDRLLPLHGHVHAANARSAQLSAINLADGSVRRRALAEELQLHATPDGKILVVAAEGSLWLAEPGLPRPPKRIARTPPICQSAMDGQGRLWLSLGPGRIVDGNRVSWAAPTTSAGVMDPPYTSVTEIDLGTDFWNIAVTRDGRMLTVAATTATTGEQARHVQTGVASFRTDECAPHRWVQAPPAFEIALMCPDAGRAFATRNLWRSAGDPEVSELICLQL